MGEGEKGNKERERESGKSWSLYQKQTSVGPVTGGLTGFQRVRTLLWLTCTHAHSPQYNNSSINLKNPLLSLVLCKRL